MRAFHLLVNPLSGGGAAPACAVPVARALREAGACVRLSYSPGPVGCRALVEESVSRDEVVVAVGGDGMVASLAGAVVERGGVLGIIPAGRGNDFARQLGLPTEAAAVADRLLTGEVRSVDVIDAGGRVVVGSVYAGVDSRASELVDRAHRLPRRLQYPYAAVRALASYQPTRFRIEVDGATHVQDAAAVIVANSGFYGSGMHIAPRADITDGVLDVVVIGAASRLGLIRSMPRVYDGSHVDLPEVLTFKGREVTLRADRTQTAYADGERLAALPCIAVVRPGALRVLG
ncbi:MAG TPA: YegS/Rv2252/BmrU family lipid kinase [Nocardioidaceae bacterium]|nr:YegS/Rv2252/BmrU family lipid kinase [Nocardioidaceae bacterium]